jgi:hypothetical protein
MTNIGGFCMKGLNTKKVILVATLLIHLFFTGHGYSEISEKEFKTGIINAASEIDPNKRLKAFEKLYEFASPYQKYLILPKMSKTAIAISNLSKAEGYAQQLLSLSIENQKDWNYGNAIHDGNIVLGMISLYNDLIEEAKIYLLKAGHTPTSPQLKTFGPNMMLADALLDKGETKAVVEYLNLLKSVWDYDDGRLDSWISAIKGGGRPYFGDNLQY